MMKSKLLLIDMFTTHVKRITLLADDVLRYMLDTDTETDTCVAARLPVKENVAERETPFTIDLIKKFQQFSLI